MVVDFYELDVLVGGLALWLVQECSSRGLAALVPDLNTVFSLLSSSKMAIGPVAVVKIGFSKWGCWLFES